MSKIMFSDLNLIQPIQNSLEKVGYSHPTPIQEQAIPLALNGDDLLGIAQTGTGKTAAFCLPLVNHIELTQLKRVKSHPRALVLTPTRELAIQIHENLQEYGQNLNQKYGVIFGGVGQSAQVRLLKSGVDVLVATPGRLLDLISQKHLNLSKVEVFVLDEADRMLDMGFMRDIKKILPLLPKKRHSLFFSATMPESIAKLANSILTNPKKVEVTPQSTTVKRIKQSVMYVEKKNKVNLLIELLKDKKKTKTLVFVEMKHVANRVAEKLQKNGIPTEAIHGNKSQNARQKAIQNFAKGKVKVLVATDIASRGIDIDGITHVINYELSNIAESYVHRIGRTARASADGEAISLVTGDEKSYLVNVEKATRQKIQVNQEHSYHSEEAEEAAVVKVGKAKKKIESQRRGEGRKPRRKKKLSSKKAKTKLSSGKKKTTTKKTSSSKSDSFAKKSKGSVSKKRSKKKFSKRKLRNKRKNR